MSLSSETCSLISIPPTPVGSEAERFCRAKTTQNIVVRSTDRQWDIAAPFSSLLSLVWRQASLPAEFIFVYASWSPLATVV